MNAGHIVMLFKFTRSLAVFHIAPFVICAACQDTVNLSDELNGNRLFGNDFLAQKFIAELLILLFKNSACVTGVSGNLAVLKYLPGIMVANTGVFDFSRVICEYNAEVIQILIQVTGVGDGVRLPKRNGVFVFSHHHASNHK